MGVFAKLRARLGLDDKKPAVAVLAKAAASNGAAARPINGTYAHIHVKTVRLMVPKADGVRVPVDVPEDEAEGFHLYVCEGESAVDSAIQAFSEKLLTVGAEARYLAEEIAGNAEQALAKLAVE